MDHDYQLIPNRQSNCCKKCINCGISKCKYNSEWRFGDTFFYREPKCNEFIIEQIME